ncbi:hypothetical protein INS49_005409 [Diaporthe citri]|uniref:uncharacterized protein n=1 Tax=Diaporthe citri TaxID=83186 RepID=UPI001C81BE6A|nr:uncharacterized protein INS49_005409 [Diaporthe citri]KAG6353700.1 hypothetical protein INS49_005409 [Diaporthe citri]
MPRPVAEILLFAKSALSKIQQRSYFDSVLCLQDIPAKSGFEPAKNRFDDFQAIHSNQTPAIHWVPGSHRYWDWSLDASSTNNDSTAIYKTAIFDPTYGFGGNGPYVEATAEQNPLNITGHTGGGSVTTGPFTYPEFKINVPSTGCLKRHFTPWIMNYFA